jgi:hypothetical protein
MPVPILGSQSGNPRFSESLEAIPLHESFAEGIPASAGVCGGEAAPGRGVMDTEIPATTPARRCENAGRWGCRTGWTTGVLGYLPFPRHDFRTILTFIARMPQRA